MKQGIGNLIRAIRLKNNLTQEEFAKKFFVDKKTIGNYENNRRMPDIVFLQKMCSLFNISMDYFRGEEKLKSNSNDLAVVVKNDKLAIFDKAQSIFLTPHIYDRILLSKTEPHIVEKCEDLIDAEGVTHKNKGHAYYFALVDNFGNINESSDFDYTAQPFVDGIAVLHSKSSLKWHLVDSNANIISKGYDDIQAVSCISNYGLFYGTDLYDYDEIEGRRVKNRVVMDKNGKEINLTINSVDNYPSYFLEFSDIDVLFDYMKKYSFNLIELAPPEIFSETENYIKIVNEFLNYSSNFDKDIEKSTLIGYLIEFLTSQAKIYNPVFSSIIKIDLMIIPELNFKNKIEESVFKRKIEKFYYETLKCKQYAIRLKEEELDNISFSGNFLCKKQENDIDFYYFYKSCTNAIFINYSKFKEGERRDLFLEIEKYIVQYCKTCGKINNKPSLMLINTIVDPDQVKENLGESYYDIFEEDEIKLLSERPSVMMIYGEQDYSSILQKVFEQRSGKIPTNDLFIFVDNIEETNLNNIDIFLMLAKSRRIYFIIVADDLNCTFWKDGLFNSIRDNFEIEYSCNKDKIECVKFGYNQSTMPNYINLD